MGKSAAGKTRRGGRLTRKDTLDMQQDSAFQGLSGEAQHRSLASYLSKVSWNLWVRTRAPAFCYGWLSFPRFKGMHYFKASIALGESNHLHVGIIRLGLRIDINLGGNEL